MQLMNDAKLIDQQFTLQVSAAKWLIKNFGALLPESHLPSRHFSRPPSVSRTSYVSSDLLVGFLFCPADALAHLQLEPHFVLKNYSFLLQDATLAYLWGRMQTVDEIKDYQKYISITWVDMLDALGRVADMKSLPTKADLEAAGE
jgi:hypothetical protein